MISQVLKINASKYHKSGEVFAIFLVWLFHLSALIGIQMGYEDWFFAKTPLNLSITALVLLLYYPINSKPHWMMFLSAFSIGMLVEWIGVHNDFLFGPYAYGANLGAKIDGVPWMIGVNWAVLLLVSAAMVQKWIQNRWLRIIGGAAMMVFLDLFLEVSAPLMDMWHFEVSPVPFKNYLTWFLVASFLHYLFNILKVKGNFRLSLHIYAAQLLFFISLWM